MRVRSTGIAVICSFVSGIAGAWAAEESPAIPSAGEAQVSSKDLAKAKGNALDAAMLGAVESAASKLLPSVLFGLNRDLISYKAAQNLRTFVKDYKLQREQVKDNVLRVEALVVPRTEKIQEELERWGILFASQRRPTIYLSPFEERGVKGPAGPRSYSAIWTERLLRRLRGLGYTVEKKGPSPQSRSGAGKTSKTDSAILIRGTFALRGNEAISGDLQAVLEPVTMELANVRGNFSLKDGPELAAGLLVLSLLEKMIPAWLKQMGEGRVYEVTVQGLSSFRPYKELRDFLTSGREGISSAQESAYSPGRVTFTVTFEGTGAELARVLGKPSFAGTRLAVSNISQRSVWFEAK
ncbi:MAG TPA: hypothetical protein VI895_12805 [Bdellovibrionota bacterium]|nr:hypothetical protein [Bdellovibrionota bacterium]